MRLILDESCARVHRASGTRGGGAPPDAGDLEDATTGGAYARLLVLPVGPVVLRQPKRGASSAHDGTAVADVRAAQAEALDVRAEHEHDERGRAILERPARGRGV